MLFIVRVNGGHDMFFPLPLQHVPYKPTVPQPHLGGEGEERGGERRGRREGEEREEREEGVLVHAVEGCRRL